MKKISNSKKQVQVQTTIPEEQAKKLEKIFFDGRGKYKNRNDVLREAITKFLETDTIKTETTK